MKTFLKAGVVLLILNEIRGLIVVYALIQTVGFWKMVEVLQHAASVSH